MIIGTVGVKNLTLKALIGCLDVEQGIRQDLNFTIEGEYDFSKILQHMDLKDTGNYAHLEDAIDYCRIKNICEETLKEAFPLMEMLSYQVQQNILKAFPQLLSLKITVEKPHAFRGKDFPFVSLSWRK